MNEKSEKEKYSFVEEKFWHNFMKVIVVLTMICVLGLIAYMVIYLPELKLLVGACQECIQQNASGCYSAG